MQVGVVGGSDLTKQKEQLGEDVLDWIDYSFSENGLIAYYQQQLIHSNSIANFIDNYNLKLFINFCLHYIADLDIPIKRGTFIEFRTGMINISPIGRNCTQEERNEFECYDKQYNIRKNMVNILKSKFGHYLSFSIGGQISIDAYPIGWNKTYCLQHLQNIKTVYFFGDKTEEGGNDYELFCLNKYNDIIIKSFNVTDPDHTITLIKNHLL